MSNAHGCAPWPTNASKGFLDERVANRIGFAGGITLAQLKFVQEVMTLGVFVPFAVVYMDQPLKLDYLWAGLCLVGAVCFIFRS